MALDSLPRFPDESPPTSPTATGPATPARGKTMLFQALFLVGFWAGIYTLHQQSRNISAAHQREQARRKQAEVEAKLEAAIEGKWRSIERGGTAILELRRGREFALSRSGREFAWGRYKWIDGEPVLGPTRNGVYCSLRYDGLREELVARGNEWFRRGVLGWEAAATTDEPREIRFKRIGE